MVHRACEPEAGSPPQAMALRSMAEGHLEAGDGRTLALIRVGRRAEPHLLAAIDWTGEHSRPRRNQSLVRLDGPTQGVSQTRFCFKAVEGFLGGAMASPVAERVAGDNEPLKQEHVRENIAIKAPKIYDLTPVNGAISSPGSCQPSVFTAAANKHNS